MSDNKIIQGLWIKGELSLMEQLSIKSFLANNHEYHLYVYDDVKNIPEGTVIKDGNKILPEDRIFTYQSGWGKGGYSGFANLFRYHLLNAKGGWWVDTDIICLKPFDFNCEYVISSSYEGKWGEVANNCVLKLPKESEFTKYLVEESDKKDPSLVTFGETGPHLIQKAVKKFNYQHYIVSYQTFCPITWRAVKKIVYPHQPMTMERLTTQVKDVIRPLIKPKTKLGRITKNSYAVHLWNEIWRHEKLDKNGVYDQNCLYERLQHKYM